MQGGWSLFIVAKIAVVVKPFLAGTAKWGEFSLNRHKQVWTCADWKLSAVPAWTHYIFLSHISQNMENPSLNVCVYRLHYWSLVKRFWVLLTSAFFSISKLFTPFRTHELHFSIFTAILQCLYFWSFSVCLNFLMKQSFFSVAQRIEAWRSNEKDISLVIAIQSDHFSHILCTHCRVPWCHVLLKEW